MNAVVAIVFMTCVQAHGMALRGTCELTALIWSGPPPRCRDLGVIDVAAWLHQHPDRVLMGEARCETRPAPATVM